MTTKVSNLLFHYDNKDTTKSYPDLFQRFHEDPQTKKFVDEMITTDAEGAFIVDIGCGNGQITMEMAKQNPRSKVLGLDCSHHFLAMANEIQPRMENIDFLVMDMFKMDHIQERSVDLFLSIYSIHVKHQNDLEPLFQHIASKLKEGGKIRFLINVLVGKGGAPLPKQVKENRVIPIRLRKNTANPFDLTNYVCLEEEIIGALIKAGFQCEYSDAYDGSTKINDAYIFREQISVFEVIFEAVLQ